MATKVPGTSSTRQRCLAPVLPNLTSKPPMGMSERLLVVTACTRYGLRSVIPSGAHRRPCSTPPPINSAYLACARQGYQGSPFPLLALYNSRSIPSPGDFLRRSRLPERLPSTGAWVSSNNSLSSSSGCSTWAPSCRSSRAKNCVAGRCSPRQVSTLLEETELPAGRF
jgi:hypothetical protein